MIQTVTGQIPEDALGRTMMHEHLAPRGPMVEMPGRQPFLPSQTIEVMEREIGMLRNLGVATVVDVTPYGKGREPHVLRELASRTGMNVVAATGFYKEPACPAFAHQASTAELARFMIREIESGLDGTDVKPGIIKVGTSKGTITATERKILVAAAQAHRETGLPITTHTTLGTMGREQVDLLLDNGVDPARVVIGHSDLNREPGYHLEILKTGATIGFDTIGKERFHYRRHHEAGYHRYAYLLEEYHVSDDDRLKALVELLRQGYASQIVLSSDILWSEGLANQATIGSWGYSYLCQRFLPRLLDAGVSADAIDTLLSANPRAVLSGERAPAAPPSEAR
jgi:predicted metal-dependent phosphotriesterase family hydrolase